MSEIKERLKRKFTDEEYRYAYDEEFSNARMAMQIKAVREKQELTQKQLADLAEMKQSRISELENANYQMWSVSTLRRLAKALDVRFSFGFESWGELLEEIEKSGRERLERPRFDEDPIFKSEKETAKVLRTDRFVRPSEIRQASEGHYSLTFLTAVPKTEEVEMGKTSNEEVGLPVPDRLATANNKAA